jgi:hypothetical protein
LGGVIKKVIIPAIMMLFGDSITSGIESIVFKFKNAFGIIQQEAMATKKEVSE